MKEIDLSRYKIRTDLIIETVKKSKYEKIYNYNNCKVSEISLTKEDVKTSDLKEGDYITLFFEDITDNNNYKNVLKVLTDKIKKIINKTNIKEDGEVLVIGLGNEKSTPDALGTETAKKCLVTKHIYDLTGTLEEGYRVSSTFIPDVMGNTGIETSDLINSVIKLVKPDFIITIDALASNSVDRLLKTIQITNTGIKPGSGVGNNRKEISNKIYNIPVISIGVPTVVEGATIVNDTINYMKKYFSYNIKENKKEDKLIPNDKINYLENNNYTLSKKETSYFLGELGNLSDKEKKVLIKDVLSPLGYNLMVTTKEIDYMLEKLTKLISEAINKSLHSNIDKK